MKSMSLHTKTMYLTENNDVNDWLKLNKLYIDHLMLKNENI